MSFISNIGAKAASILNPSGIDAFKSSISTHQGLARPNRFAIIMAPPEQSLINLDIQSQVVGLLSGNSFNLKSLINDPRDVAILCESCSMPGREVTTLDYQTVRNNLKIPNGIIQEDITFAFHVTNDYYMKKMFDRWLDLVLNMTKYRTPYLKDYARDVVIQQLNAQNLPVYGVKLIDAFPTSVNSIELDNTSDGTTARMTVSFTYRDFVIENALQSGLSGIKNAISGITKII
jgi:hypothetical protein